MFKKVIGIALLLALITGLSGFAIASADSITFDIIGGQLQAAKNRSLQEVYSQPGELKDESAKYLAGQGKTGLTEVTVCYQAGVPKGVIYTVETQGYNGTIRSLVAFDISTKAVSGVKVLSQSETPGLGNNSAKKWFSDRFLNKGAAKQLEVTKLVPGKDNEIQAITAATITSRAVVSGVNIARQHFLQNFAQ